MSGCHLSPVPATAPAVLNVRAVAFEVGEPDRCYSLPAFRQAVGNGARRSVGIKCAFRSPPVCGYGHQVKTAGIAWCARVDPASISVCKTPPAFGRAYLQDF